MRLINITNCKMLKSHLSEREMELYEDFNEGWTVKTPDCLLVTFEGRFKSIYIIFEGPFAKNNSNMCLYCGSHYEIVIDGDTKKIDFADIEY